MGSRGSLSGGRVGPWILLGGGQQGRRHPSNLALISPTILWFFGETSVGSDVMQALAYHDGPKRVGGASRHAESASFLLLHTGQCVSEFEGLGAANQDERLGRLTCWHCRRASLQLSVPLMDCQMCVELFLSISHHKLGSYHSGLLPLLLHAKGKSFPRLLMSDGRPRAVTVVTAGETWETWELLRSPHPY